MLVYSEAHILLTCHGTLGTPVAEEWSFGVRIRSTLAPMNTAALRGLAVAAETPVAELFFGTSMKPAALTHIKAAWIQTDGHYPPGTAAGENALAAPAEAPTAFRATPFQTALAVSLGTAIARGNASKGRFFLPLPRFASQLDGRLTAPDAMTTATAVKTFINGIKAIDPAFTVAVFSQGSKAVPAPSVQNVTFVRCGRVLDTIRSRRRALLEDYQRVNVP